jgi:glycosyltransferase involved in cell wall biosynthesis
MSLRVGLNALHLVPGETGGGEIYARGLVPALIEVAPDLELVLFAGREAAPALSREDWANSVEVVRVPVKARSRTRRVLAEQTLLRRAGERARVALLHNLFTTAPAFPGVPQVTTIYDLIYKQYPETHGGLRARGLELLVPLAARRSRRVLTLSKATKRDVVEHLGVPADRVDVTYAGPGMAEGLEPVAEAELRQRLGLGNSPIVLAVAAKRPHKNVERLIDAFEHLENERAVLLVVGYSTAFEPDLRKRAASLGDRARFTGWVDDATLEGLYRAATCLAFPSLAEGFGLPVVEAMRRGLPVACSNTTSLPEVAGDAAVYFDPTDTRAITAAIESILDDSKLRERLHATGLVQAAKFSWEATARVTLASYERALT